MASQPLLGRDHHHGAVELDLSHMASAADVASDSPHDIALKYDRLCSRDGHLNFRFSNLPWWEQMTSGGYFSIINWSWFKLLLFAFLVWCLTNIVFASLYMIDLEGIGNSSGSFLDALFFSVQTMATIGYGVLYPKSIYVNFMVYLETWVGLILHGLITAFLFAKIARASRLRHTVKFSERAVINEEEFYHEVDKATGIERYVRGDPCIAFRIVNMRKRQLCVGQIRLLLLRQIPVTQADPSASLKTARLDASQVPSSSSARLTRWVVSELAYEMNYQLGRTRDVAFSAPLLPFPWTVVHRIDQRSPLYGLTAEDMRAQRTELIAVFEAVDELSSNNFQSRWSYTANDILFNHRFIPMVSRQLDGKFEVDMSRLSQTEQIYGFQDRDSFYTPPSRRQ